MHHWRAWVEVVVAPRTGVLAFRQARGGLVQLGHDRQEAQPGLDMKALLLVEEQRCFLGC